MLGELEKQDVTLLEGQEEQEVHMLEEQDSWMINDMEETVSMDEESDVFVSFLNNPFFWDTTLVFQVFCNTFRCFHFQSFIS